MKNWGILAAFVVIGSASAQTFSINSITGGTNGGSVSVWSQYDHVNGGNSVSYVVNGQHDGIICNMNSDCTVEVSTTFASSSFVEAQSTIFLTFWSMQTDDSAGEEVGRVKFRLTQTSYNPSTGAYVWSAALRLNTNRSGTYGASYGFALYRGKASTKNVVTPNLSKQCSGVGGCTVSPTTNVLNVAPTGTNFLGFMMTGFDVATTSGNNHLLKKLVVDGSTNAAGTAEAGFDAANNRKQGMTCQFIVDPTDPENVTCTVYTASFASEGGHLGYLSSSTQFVNVRAYDAQAPNPNYWTYQSYSVPPVGGATFPGLFTPLRVFWLEYTDGVPQTRVLGAGCAATDIDFDQSPDVGRAVVFGQISLNAAGDPTYDMLVATSCFSNWAMIWP